jgi:hypothetical protein
MKGIISIVFIMALCLTVVALLVNIKEVWHWFSRPLIDMKVWQLIVVVLVSGWIFAGKKE